MAFKVALVPCFYFQFFRFCPFLSGLRYFLFLVRWSFLHIFCTISFWENQKTERYGWPGEPAKHYFFLRSVTQRIDSLNSCHPSWEKPAFLSLLFAKVGGIHIHTAPLKSLQSKSQDDPNPSKAGPLTHSLARGPVVCVSVFLRFLLDHDLDVSKHSRIPSSQHDERAQTTTMGVYT